MYYVHDTVCDNVLYAICLYGPMMFDFKGSSYMVDMTTGIREELSAEANGAVLSRRERQVLSLIDEGMKSVEIARRLNISVHTVSRHRQEILAKLQVKNSIEACRRAKAMKLI
jgi:DNA-binding NarL/FixJ family response regulator|nr:helix-turn-helix transcriptional regulator [Paramuribaculum intestinale]